MKYLLSFLLLFFVACNHSGKKQHARIFVLQPLGHISPDLVTAMFNNLRKINSNVVLKETLPLPISAYYAPRKRYRADSIIRHFNRYRNNDTVVACLTDCDISTSKGIYNDWGVMGLGFRPGNVCVISTWRLDTNKVEEQYFKVMIHELGHTEGLPHCPVKSCFMRNANGGRPLDEEKNFCKDCKAFLIKKGWKLE